MPPVIVRKADLADASDGLAVLEMTRMYASDPMGGHADLSPDCQQRLIHEMRDHQGIVVFLAFEEGQAVGIATCLVSFSTFAARKIINIHDLSVIATHRGRGIARMLIAAVEAEAIRQDCCRITLEVSALNERARDVYAALGFRGARETDADRITYFCGKEL
jgi:ribosomal protein S18 acetylase RimI-like enzyme